MKHGNMDLCFIYKFILLQWLPQANQRKGAFRSKPLLPEDVLLSNKSHLFYSVWIIDVL